MQNLQFKIGRYKKQSQRSCSKQGVFEIAHYNGVVKIRLKVTLVAMVQ